MLLLILALIFGIVVLLILLATMYRNKGRGNRSTIVKILKAIVLVETVAFVVLFVMVLIRTSAM